MKAVLASLAALPLVACGGGAGGNATPTPTASSPEATSTPTASPAGVCDYLNNVVAVAIANAESRGVESSELVEALGEAQLELQEFGVDFVARKRTEPLGRAVLEVGATLAKIRFGISAGDSEQVRAFADQARRYLELPPIVDRCGEISTGEA